MYLPGHDSARCNVSDFANGSSISTAKLFQHLQVLSFQIKLVLYPDLELLCSSGKLINLITSRSSLITLRWLCRPWGRFVQRQTLDILALKRTSSEGVRHGEMRLVRSADMGSRSVRLSMVF